MTRLETHIGQPQANYSWDRDFYTKYLIELRSVLLRAQSHGTTELTAKQVTLMIDNLQQLRLAHEAGPLPLPTIQATRDLFNKSWQAIIKRQIAERRGEKLL